jgi:S1-C subfamily serine protease
MNLAEVVEQAAPCVVAVGARSRLTSSGIHWRSGLIITADETIKRTQEITITLPDRQTVPATLIGRDPGTDVAILQIPSSELPLAQIAETSSLKIGHLVLSLGRSDSGMVNATWGAVSALGGAWRSSYGGNIDQFVRLDLTLCPCAEGGPLVDAMGRVVGMTVSGPRRSVLAIPTATINRVVDALQEKGHLARGYLGLGMQPVRLPESLKETLGLTAPGGVIVLNVEPNSPADRGGVLIGDVLLSFNDTPVFEPGDVQAMLGWSSVGQPLKVQLLRGGTLVSVELVPVERVGKGG